MSQPKEPWFKCRYIVICLVMCIQFFLSSQKINLGVSIVAMVNNTALPQKEQIKSDSCPNLLTNASDSEEDDVIKDGEFSWSPKLQGYVLGMSSVGFVLTIPLGGKACETFGSRKVMLGGLFISSVLTIASPFASWCSVYMLMVVQGVRGFFQGGFLPSQAALIANWCPKSERGFSHTFVFTGSCLGVVLGSYISGLLCNSSLLGGWPSGFYVIGGGGLLVSLLMFFSLYDSPTDHPRISPSELKYISENQENVLTRKRPKTPWRSLFTSVPVYALAYAFCGQTWARTHFTALQPTFLGTIMHYPIEKNGLFSALPFLLQMILSLISGWISGYLNKKNLMTVDTARKFWNTLSCLGFSICMLGINFAGCNRQIIVVLSILSLGLTGFGFAGCWIAAPDMSPTFAASVNSLSCFFGFTPTFLVPLIGGLLTNENQTLEQWHKINFISIGIVMSSGVIFALFGSAEIQPWNEIKEKTTQQKKDETRF